MHQALDLDCILQVTIHNPSCTSGVVTDNLLLHFLKMEEQLPPLPPGSPLLHFSSILQMMLDVYGMCTSHDCLCMVFIHYYVCDPYVCR